MSAETGTFEFKAETRKLLDILVHSLYASKDIFLRELVSNASDALDKLRLAQLSGEAAEAAGADELPLEIRVTVDKEAGTVTIADSGIGMSRDEIIQNIGTIAHSGTAEFARRLAESKDPNQASSVIGQFGVGFYSVFMVAETVELTTRSAAPDSVAYTWTSDGKGSFTITEAGDDAPARGTSLKIILRDDAKEYANADRLREVIRTHSSFLSWPILVDGERVNTVQAIWREPKFQIKPEQYAEFYKHLTYDVDDPLETIHIAADAPIQWTALLFAPQKNHDLLMGSYQGQQGLDLYVRRVLIQHGNKDVLPEYLGFLRGVLDSEDLPLNVARETLQENRLLRAISTSLTKQVLSNLKKLAESDAEKYAKLWREHGKIFKLGYSDYANKDAFAELLRFGSTACEDADGLVSLAEYKGRMKEGQKEIYHLSAPSREAALANPALEILRRKGVEVLLLLDPLDEFVMESVHQYGELNLVPAERADLATVEAMPDVEGAEGGGEKPEALSDDEALAVPALTSRMKTILGERVTEVRESRRLQDSPVVLVAPDGQPSSGMQKIMRMITKDDTPPARILEINTRHPVLRSLLKVATKDLDDPFLTLATEQLYESAMIQDGYMGDPHTLVRHMRDVLAKASELYVK